MKWGEAAFWVLVVALVIAIVTLPALVHVADFILDSILGAL